MKKVKAKFEIGSMVSAQVDSCRTPKVVEVKLLKYLPKLTLDKLIVYQVYVTEYPKGQFNLAIYNDDGVEKGFTVDHDVPMNEIIGQVSKNPLIELMRLAEKHNLELPGGDSLRELKDYMEVLDALGGAITGDFKNDIVAINEVGCKCTHELYTEAYQCSVCP